MQIHPAELYDYIYSWKDYRGEAECIKTIMASQSISPKGRILEVACGTGSYLQHFNGMDRLGVDLCPVSLRIAGYRMPDALFLEEDMRDIALERPVDVILGLFGATAYLSPSAFPIALGNFFQALRPGGLLFLETWVSPGHFEEGIPHMQTYESPNFKLARMVVTRRTDRRAILNFNFLLARGGWRAEPLTCQDALWLYETDEIQLYLEEAGFRLIEKREGFMEKSTLLVLIRP